MILGTAARSGLNGRILARGLARVFFLVGCFGASLFLAPWARAEEASEYQVKAAFLYNFAKFIEWPADDSWKVEDPLTICVVGEDPFGAILDDTVRGKTIARHSVVIRRLKAGRSWKGCRIAFVSSSEKDDPSLNLASSTPAGVLTVGETKGFAARGGIINFVVERDRVRFEVNVDAAERAGLKISSKLLSLAKIVRSQDPRGRS